MLASSLLRRLASLEGLPESTRTSLLRSAEVAPPGPFAESEFARDVRVYDCANTEILPGSIVHDPSAADVVVKRVWVTSKKIRTFLAKVLERDSIDGKGRPIDSSVRYSRSYSNGFWDGARCVFGEGDGLMFLDFTSADDFVAHEVVHGLTQFTSGFEYRGEAGALNESMSDVFGVSFRQWARGEVSSPRWGLGSEMLGPLATSRGWDCLRNLEQPGSPKSMTQQPSHYKDYDSRGEPHINSGIPNHAFYLAATSLGIPSWEVAKIWYAALVDPRLSARSTFVEFAALTVSAAGVAPAAGTVAQHRVADAWRRVGVAVTP